MPNNKSQINLKFQISNSKHRFEVLLFSFYLLLAVIITYPLILNFSSSVYSIPERLIDGLADIYDLWWWKQTVLYGGDPNFISNLGIDGVTLTRSVPYSMLVTYNLAKWLTLILDEVFAFNFLILASFPLAGLSMYFLAFEVTKNRWASILAGFIFAFAPLHRRYAFEWLGNAQWHWLPLYVLCLIKLDKTKSIKWGLFTGLFFSITFIENYYFGYFTIIFTFFFILFRLIQTWLFEKKFYLDRYRFQSFLLAAVTIAVLTLPITTTFVRESSRLAAGETTEIPGFVRDEWPRFAFSARPWFYLLPDTLHPVFGSYVQKIYDWIANKPPYFITKPFYPREHALYLGWVPLVLGAVAVVKSLALKTSSERGSGSRRWVWLFLSLGIVMIVFSAPPYATISLHKIYFPSHFLAKIFPMFRSYARIGVLVLLCVSVLAALGIKYVLEKLETTKSKAIFLLAVFGLIFFEFLDFPPFNNESIELNPAHQWVKDQPGDFAVAEYLVVDNKPLIQQRLYGKRFVNPLRWAPREVRDGVDKVDDPSTPAKLSSWGVKYLILHTRTPEHLQSIPSYKLVASFPEDAFYIFEVTPIRQIDEGQ